MRAGSIGRTLRQVLGDEVANHGIAGKGRFGQVLETRYFRYPLNSESRPDFADAGLELKATGLVPDGHGSWKAKERVKLNAINFHEVSSEDFWSSTFLRKNLSILLICYAYEKGQLAVDNMVELVDNWRIPEQDLIQIEREWNLIVDLVREGRAHELSESLTNYIGACTTGQGGGRDLQEQPCSDVLAKRRAFSFKQPYVTRIVREFVAREDRRRAKVRGGSLVTSLDELREAGSIEHLALRRFEPHLGRTEADITREFGIRVPHSKNRRETLNLAILGVRGTRRVDEFDKAGITMRSFTLRMGTRLPKEDFPLPAFEFSDLSDERWGTSALRTHLLNRFLTVFYMLDGTGTYTLKDAVFWAFPESELDGAVRETWVRTVRLVRQGRIDGLPKAADTHLVFLRTHGRDSRDTSRLPDGRAFPRVSFWLYRAYLKRVFEDVGTYPIRASAIQGAR